MKKVFSLIFIIVLISVRLTAQEDIRGNWTGNIEISGFKLDIFISFKTDSGKYSGSMDIPMQSAKNLPLSNIKFENPSVSFELDVPNGLASFKGELIDGKINGKFFQSGMSGKFSLEKSTEIKKEEVKKEKPPYKEEEVKFNNGDITLAGTLTIPEYAGKHPAVVLISGSGPQNRDEEILGFKPFEILADYFTRNGIAVLRYDDRGVGESTGKNVSEYTTEDFAGDVIEAVKYLESRKDIRDDQIGVLGHSEGGIVGPLAAVKYPKIAFVICMAGTGVNGREIILEQSKLIALADSSAKKEEVEKDIEFLKEALDAAVSGNGWDIVKKKSRIKLEEEYDKMSEEEKNSIQDKEKWISSAVDMRLNTLTSPWMKYFLTYEPAPVLENVKCPVLLLFGGKDLQVPPHQNEKPMSDALKKGGNKHFDVKIFPDANHLFQEAQTGSPSEYGSLKKEFVTGFTDYVTNWILKYVHVSR